MSKSGQRSSRADVGGQRVAKSPKKSSARQEEASSAPQAKGEQGQKQASQSKKK